VTERRIPAPGFAGDEGASDPRLAAALAAYAADPARAPEVLAALAAARVLVPVVALPGAGQAAASEELRGEPGESRRDSSTDMALVTLQGTDGRRALPVFSSLTTLAAWDSRARPVPVESARAALSAAAEGAQVLVLDVAGPTSYVVVGPALRRLAEGDPCRPAYDDPHVAAEVAGFCAGHPAVVAAWLVPAAGLDARVALRVEDPDDAAGVERVARRLATELQHSEALRAVVLLGIDLAVLPADVEPTGHPVFRRG
jgi:hypothetical protein